jgi:glyoxylase-like metal-dependent hydrolase (beta-lactamase superfamily II)
MEPSQGPTIPHSNATVDVAIIDTTTRMGNVPGSHYLGPHDRYPALLIPGHATPSYSFLIVHPLSQTKVLFDLGLRIDWKTASSPAILSWVQGNNVQVNVEKDVATILQEGGTDPEGIDAVIFSHHHFDHTGDPSKFSDKMKIVVGPGYKQKFLPGWPENRKMWETTSDLYRDREVVEISFGSDEDQSKLLRIGEFQAYDYFGDGSFYLLNTPGHTLAHLSALARTTAPGIGESMDDESTFILLGGDIAHNCALFRPTPLCQLPDSISYESTEGSLVRNIPGATLATLHRVYSEEDGGRRARVTPFCTATGPHYDISAAQRSIDVLSTFDGMKNVFTALAHDLSLDGIVDLFPQSTNRWKEKGWRERCLWRFLETLTGNKDSLALQLRSAKI